MEHRGQARVSLRFDWALSIAMGEKWQDHKTQKGHVVYIVAEGTGGITKRVRAWMRNKGVVTIEGAFFVLASPQPRNDDDLQALITSVKPHNPTLIIFDTLAQTAVGADENSSQHMGEWVNACRQLRAATNAAVLAIHHTGKTGDIERGSSALRAAADSMSLVKRSGHGTITLKNDKQKDDEEAKTIALRLEAVPMGAGERPSCVLVSADEEVVDASLNTGQSQALQILAAASVTGLKSGMWQKAFTAKTHFSERSFQRCKKSLLELGHVETVPGSNSHYRLSPSGHSAIGVSWADTTKDSGNPPATATPLRGGRRRASRLKNWNKPSSGQKDRSSEGRRRNPMGNPQQPTEGGPETRTTGLDNRICKGCGGVIKGRRRNGFCSDRCRMQSRRVAERQSRETLLTRLKESISEIERELLGKEKV